MSRVFRHRPHRPSSQVTRRCVIEEMESRELLSVTPFATASLPDLTVGLFCEDQYSSVGLYAGQDAGNIFQVAWSGGDATTALSQLTIQLRENCFFDTDGQGSGLSHPLELLSGSDMVASWQLYEDDNGISCVTFAFHDGVFTSDKSLRFFVDVDETLTSPGETPDATVSGTEIGGTTFVAAFTSRDFEDVTLHATLANEFTFTAGLTLPSDRGEIGTDNSHMTAGGKASATMQAKTSSLSGYVYEDHNNDGNKDAGEAGIAGVTLRLEIWDGTQYVATGKTTTTIDGGYYEFTDLEAFQHYRIVETQPSDYLSGKNTAGNLGGVASDADDTIGDIALGANKHGENYNFGELKPGSLLGTVYEDNNDNGVQDAFEAGIAGVRIAIQYFDAGTGIWIAEQTDTTDASGHYSFANLDPLKIYRVVEDQPSGYASGRNTAGTLGGDASDADDTISGILVGYYQSGINYNFGELRQSSLAGTVFEDDNSNGIQEAGETGIAGVMLTLQYRDAGGNWIDIANTFTGVGGAYLFENLDPRLTYRIVETQPANYYTTQNRAGNAAVNAGTADNVNDLITGIKASVGQNATGYNFGERHYRASLSGTVFEDDNSNGTQDVGEAGIAGVTLTLQHLDASGNWVTTQPTTTDVNGNYTFSEIDPRLTCRVVETQPDGYKTTHNTAGNGAVNPGTADDANDWISEIIVTPQQNASGYNFGERFMFGSLSGTVYEDANDNGIIDPDETLLAGVRVELCRWNAVTGQFESTGIFTLTDTAGNYQFDNLVPGTYCVTRAITPAGYCDGKETLGDHGGEISTNAPRMFNISVVGDEASQNYNFALAQQGEISGFVFIDTNGNGIKDDGEKALDGVTVTLYVLRDGVYVATTKTATTDADGFYKFTELCAFKTYAVLETQPTAYDDGDDYVGTINGVKVGSNAINDFLTGITLGNGDAGIQYNFTELEKPTPPDPPDPPVPPVPPTPTPLPPIPWTTLLVPTLPYSPFVSQGFAGTTPQLALTTFSTTNFGGGGIAPSDVSWHLSVLNGGYPREGRGLDNTAMARSAASVAYVSVAWDAAVMDESVWYVRDKSGRVVKKGTFGVSGGKPIAADFNGDGIDEMAVFRFGEWFIDINGNGQWDANDILCLLGSASDQAVVGDWDGDGKIDIGVFGPQWAGDGEAIPRDPGLPSDLNGFVATQPKNLPVATSELGVRVVKHSRNGNTRLDAIDHVFRYGGAGDVAVTGDWNGDGVTEIGVYNNGTWQLDFNGDGRFDARDVRVDSERLYGVIPVTGDFNGDGKTNIGVFADGVWHLDTTGDFAFDTQVKFGQVGDLPVTGNFSGNGITELGVVRARVADTMLTRRDTVPAMSSDVAPRVASQYIAIAGDGADADTSAPARQERTQHTPFTSLPLR